ncbi:carboxymuconolactone decarboxylase family protein [Janibacter sp. FSL W8-0316]|uniref:carboxymuconolactone decarboxylase family protein n=1 Tax=Janibacter sp. FSL W8-0316 TaxID=2975325 RepID=UPI0030FB8B7D
MTARIAPGNLRELGPVRWGFARAAGRVTGTEPPAIFTTLGRTKGLFTGWLHFAGRLMPFGSLERRESELVILTVATARGCEYEREHHRLLGQRAGLTSAEIEGILADEVVASLSPRERVLRESAQALVATKDLDDEQWQRLRSVASERESIELLLLVGHYDMLATTLMTLRLEPDKKA